MTRRSWMLLCGAVTASSMLFLAVQSLRAVESRPRALGWVINAVGKTPCEIDSGFLGACYCDDGVSCYCDDGVCR